MDTLAQDHNSRQWYYLEARLAEAVQVAEHLIEHIDSSKRALKKQEVLREAHSFVTQHQYHNGYLPLKHAMTNLALEKPGGGRQEGALMVLSCLKAFS